MTAIRQDARWPRAHEGLRRVYEKRVALGVTQAEFGELYGLGSQAMVWQYLSGWTPLNYDAAAKFAKGLRCTIRDFSPEMADELEKEILPVLGMTRGGRWRRAVGSLAVVALGIFSPPASVDAAILHNVFSRTELALNTHWLRLLRRLRELVSERELVMA